MKIEDLQEQIEKMKLEIEEMSLKVKNMKLEVNRLLPAKKTYAISDNVEIRMRVVVNEAFAQLLKVPTYTIGGYTFDVNTRQLSFDNQLVTLTIKESFLLVMFAANLNAFVQREHMLDMIWGASNYKNSRSMDVYVCKLRKLLEKDPNIIILNIHGKGYKMLVG
jgi:DNA-binding response OmpR family regulator